MRTAFGVLTALALVVAAPAAAQKAGEKTLSGKISDSNCKDKHVADEHGGAKPTDAECTRMCVNKKRAKYVLIGSDGKMYQLANQKSKTIASHAGQNVELSGEVTGDTINAKRVKTTAPAK